MINLASIENNEQSNEVDNDIIQEPYMDISEEDIEEPKNEELFTIERRRKILILQFYLNEFAHKLTVYKDIDFEGLSGEELDKIKNEFDFIIGTKNTVNISVKAFQQSIYTLEHICCLYTPLKIKGLSNINNDPELIEDIKHLCLQNMALIKTKPEHRILFKVISTMTALHSYNTLNDNALEVANNGINNNNDGNNISNDFSDL